MIRTALSDKARAALIGFCAENLKPGLDPVRYADNFNNVDFGEVGGVDGALYEIRSLHQKDGVPATICFRAEDDFCVEEIED
ncbi:hypothetical protein FBT96_12400 [Rhodobacter capsulatus]|uniref:Uncharacterized protein n=1 Tax=Rhodobacter capsulatus TaxID=1061 RepID=A0A4U1JPJ2_RHOCA|nr:hypothetical protein [Rhodobacter capsulatus]TKD17938.1 hypothetical protein FBT96_12400 [Rhodobacter capsulatus]